MLHRVILSAFAALSLLSASAAHALPEIGKPAPDFTAKAADGATVKLSEHKGKIVVMEWNNPECPFVVKHYGGGNMQKQQAYAQEKGVVWLSVNSSAEGKQGHMDAAKALETVKAKGAKVTHYLLDPEGAVGRLYGAKTTPHMFVIDKDGNVAYMGAIDDKPTPHAADIDGAVNYVRAAIDHLTSGKPVATASTQAYGCLVKYAD